MYILTRFVLSFSFAAAMVLLGSGSIRAGEPTEAIRSAIDQGVAVLKGTQLDDEKQRAQAIDQLRKIVYPLFDFREMAMRSLGPQWRRIDGRQQDEFVTAFRDLLEVTYADQIILYDGHKVEYVREIVNGNFAEVQTRVIGKEAYSVNYRLHLVNGEWRIYDVVAENISIVSNYRSQFSRFLARATFEELLKQLRAKAA
jgi:phospholipid transport system substrate-binding protein